jgi:L-cysteine/cystine lyase
MPTSLEQHRKNFPTLAHKSYFNFGGQGLLPSAALGAIIAAYQRLQEQGAFSIQSNALIEQQNALTRQVIAGELGVPASTITLTENVTDGCNIVLWGIEWQQGDQILMGDCEHPGVIAILREISRRFGVEIGICPLKETLNQGDPVAIVQQHLTPKTRLVVLSHLLWNTGQVLPLADIVNGCHHYPQRDRPIEVLVDAAQSVGSLALNLSQLGVDYYAFTGHKWLCGPAGVGGLYVHPEALNRLHPTFIGWRGIILDDRGQPVDWKGGGQRFEVATSAYPLYEGLQAAIALHQQWGTAQDRYQRLCELSHLLWQRLSQVEGVQCLKNSPPEAGLVSFKVTTKLSHQALVQQLERQGFLLRTLLDPDCIRACVHYFTLESEIEQLVGAIEALPHL